MPNASSASVPIASRRNVPQRKEKKSGFLGRLFGRGSVAASDSGGGAAAANFEIGAFSNVEHKSHAELEAGPWRLGRCSRRERMKRRTGRR